MIRNEEWHEDRPARLEIPALLALLGFVVVFGFVVSGFLAMNAFSGPRASQIVGAFAANLLLVGAIWGLSRLKPSKPKTVALSVLLAFVALLGFGGFAAVAKAVHAANFLGLWYWKTLCLLAANLLVFVGAIWGLLKLKPWKALKRSGEPVSPATRRTNKLFGLAGGVATVGVVVLIQATHDKDNPLGAFSNSPISLGIAIFAIATWLVAMAIEWWWYFSADEHERKAVDFSSLVARSLFTTVTPVWWVAARAGLLPQPDAMVLWAATQVVSGIAWFWHRSR